jgi:UDP-2,3-diacylglucosamine hydrolase
MRVFVISDLHILDNLDPLYSEMLQWLDQVPLKGDKVVFAGDVFDLFVGNKKIFVSRYKQFFLAIQQACARGICFHFIEGNHDFLLRRIFVKTPHVALHTCELTFDVGGKRFFISHGDEANRGNIQYILLRKILRTPLLKAIIAVTPGKLIDLIGHNWSNLGKKKKEILYENLEPAQQAHLRKPYRNFAAQKVGEGYDFVIFGHTHDADEFRFQVGDRIGQYINVGFPRKTKTVLRWDEGDEFVKRVSFDPFKP